MSQKLKKWLKRIFFSAIFFALTGWLAIFLILQHCIAKPPPLPADISITSLTPEARDGKIWIGKSWVGQREGLTVIYLKGSPFEIGYADGVLMRDKMHTLENGFLEMIRGYVPQHWVMEVLKNYVIWRNRHLSDFIPQDYRMEIYAASLGSGDIHPEEGNFYNRLLNYHAAHDVSYMMIDNPFIAARAGCTAFGAWGSATANGDLITGRNFDWEAAEVFSRDRVVEMCEPDGKIPFISLSWAGMTGVVSGMNRAGVSVTVNGAPSSLPKETATPVAIVAREIMERAHNLDEALKILRDAKVFVSTIWLVGSRADGKFVVVEKTPDVTNVREAEGDSIVCPNHFETAGLKDDARNTNYMAEATSVSRETRLKELLRQSNGKIDSRLAVNFLRDRDLPGGIFAGDGNRATLNAFIATHATVMDLTSNIFWAASPPNQLGKFVAFDVNDFSRELPELTVPADPTLADGEYERTRQAQQFLADGLRELKNKNAQAALELADKAEALNPGFYQNATLRGRALLALNRNDEAAQSFEKALAEHPAFLKEKQELEILLQQTKSAK
ncbi:MAG TPA: C45 family autoproteolytic acyltransferase/hydrolase [Verrucomicrobiae bacterium]|jgi:tetratricopeptide (TPR) repeat protein|nr:C45 family autoproteolytic acyltransferase/hydrolase [Verrucomicrobiae bacterium]